MTILQLSPPFPLDTPKGPGMAILMRDYGVDFEDLWTVAIDSTGELWTFKNSEVRAQVNVTFGRRTKKD